MGLAVALWSGEETAEQPCWEEMHHKANALHSRGSCHPHTSQATARSTRYAVLLRTQRGALCPGILVLSGFSLQ